MLSSNKPSLHKSNIFLNFLNFISPFAVYSIVGESMEPTLHDRDRVIVSKLAYILTQPKIGDIVAVVDPRDHKVLIKRITRIENDRYFVEGDNKLHSTDSWKFGMLDKRAILGKVISP